MAKRIIYILFVFFLFSCGGTGERKIINSNSNNFIIILDLSDRLISPEQVKRDINILENVLWFEFKKIVKTKFYVRSNDVFQIFIADQNSSPISETKLLDFQDSLQIDLNQLRPREKKKAVELFEKRFKKVVRILYKLSAQNKDSNSYSGADIWKFFNEELNDKLVKKDKNGNEVKNNVFVLTDGYLYVKEHSQEMANEFPEINYNFKKENLSVSILEIDPKNQFRNEKTRLKLLWERWFIGMGINYVQVLSREGTNSILKAIHNFIMEPYSCNIEKIDQLKSQVYIKSPSKDDNYKNVVVTQNEKRQIALLKTKNINDIKINNTESDSDFLTRFFSNEIFKNQIDKNSLVKFCNEIVLNFPSKGSEDYLILCSYKTSLLNQMKNHQIINDNLVTKIKSLCI